MDISASRCLAQMYVTLLGCAKVPCGQFARKVFFFKLPRAAGSGKSWTSNKQIISCHPLHQREGHSRVFMWKGRQVNASSVVCCVGEPPLLFQKSHKASLPLPGSNSQGPSELVGLWGNTRLLSHTGQDTFKPALLPPTRVYNRHRVLKSFLERSLYCFPHWPLGILGGLMNKSALRSWFH